MAPGQAVVDDVTDTMLVTAVRAGDTDAFALLYRRYAPSVRRAVAALVRDPHRVEDAVQEAFVRALERIGDLRDPERLGAWLKTIARNAATDGLRARGASDLDAVPEANLEDVALGSAELAEVRELTSLVQGALADLAPRDAKALAMAGYLNASPAEIAAELGVSAGAAKVVLHRARGRLRTALKIKVLVRGQAGGCVEFADRVAASDYVVAARHVTSCANCQRAGSVALRLYAPTPETWPGSSVTVEIRDALGRRGVPLRDELWVGRECVDAPAHARLIVDDARVSRTHLKLVLDPHTTRVRATDLSRNGTLLNGAEMPSGAAVTLLDGDTLQLGDTHLTVRDAVATTMPPAPVAAAQTPSFVVAAKTARVSSPDEVPAEVAARLAEAGRLFGALVDVAPDALLFVRWPAGDDARVIEDRHAHFVEFAGLLGDRAGVRFAFEILPARA